MKKHFFQFSWLVENVLVFVTLIFSKLSISRTILVMQTYLGSYETSIMKLVCGKVICWVLNTPPTGMYFSCKLSTRVASQGAAALLKTFQNRSFWSALIYVTSPFSFWFLNSFSRLGKNRMILIFSSKQIICSFYILLLGITWRDVECCSRCIKNLNFIWWCCCLCPSF